MTRTLHPPTAPSPVIQLRPYQREAVDAVYNHLRERKDNPCVVLPTGSGKAIISATICRDAVQLWDGRVLVLAHVKELLAQAVDKLQTIAPDLRDRIGVYSAGLKRRDTEHPIVVAGIQSVHRRADELGQFDLILIDEAHSIPPDGDGTYRSFLADMKVINPNVRLIGLTATPYRMTTGKICGPDNLLNEVCYEVGVRELIAQGYLCPLRSKAGSRNADFDSLHIRGGEYIAGEVENLMNDNNLVLSACREIVELTQDRRSVLIFASGVQHGLHIAEAIEKRHGAECGFISGETLPFDRDETLRRFRAGDLKYLCNVNVLTTGFDAPNIDCVALVRPTLSPGLFYQMVGRGFRLHPGKSDCLVLDFGGNVLRHGPVDDINSDQSQAKHKSKSPVKVCPQCREIVPTGRATCPQCGHVFPAHDPKHDPTASCEDILSNQTSRKTHEVKDVFYEPHTKRFAPPGAPRTMRVDYRIGLNDFVSEWICFEHGGYARQKAEGWWNTRSNEPVPDTVDKAVRLAEAGALAPTVSVTVQQKPDEKFERIVKYKIGPKPPRLDSYEEPPAPTGSLDDPDIPF